MTLRRSPRARASRQGVYADALRRALEIHRAVAFVDESRSQQRALRSNVRGGRDADDALEPECLEDPTRGRHDGFGGEALSLATPRDGETNLHFVLERAEPDMTEHRAV